MNKAFIALVAFVIGVGVVMILTGFTQDWDTQKMLHEGLGLGATAGVVGAVAALNGGKRSAGNRT